ncbi:GIY-YIG nuclease family protein [Gracilimonas amylolytica]|uniref:GIY-YIG nuclease family protein n=1 Tax=Gracilimonas amylolytica TaxID=1749045 RepID=UPI000CD8F146|nr:GIY-YIG nuclease family protein [Gracilimonas amylolytica]
MFETYIIYSSSRDRFYVGSTGAGVQKRLERHNEGWTRSTKSGIPWELKYVRSFETKTEALQWENHIKRQKSRSYLEALIASDENECDSTKE